VDKNEMDKNGADEKTMEWIKKAVDKKKKRIKTRIESCG